MVDARYCPYCERWLNESVLRRAWEARHGLVRVATCAPRRARLSQRALLAAGVAAFGIIAVACIVAAAIVA